MSISALLDIYKMAANSAENQYAISFHDSAWIPILSAENVLDYFCQRTNQFYDRTCNNEVVKMQRLDPGQLQYMNGVEYVLIHAQDPILYVIRKQMRYSPTQVSYLAVYYILAGVVYQAPDLGSLINSRLLSFVQKLDSAFGEVQSYSQYAPAKGYSWNFKEESTSSSNTKHKKKQNKETSSLFQRERIDVLLRGFLEKFPPIVPDKQVQSEVVDPDTNAPVKTESSTHGSEKNKMTETIIVETSKSSGPTVTDSSVEKHASIEQTASSDISMTKGDPPPEKKRKMDT